MISAIATLAVLSALLILPGWLWFRRQSPQSPWLFGIPVFGIALWLALSAAHFGGTQSITNIVEVVWVATASVAATYIEFFRARSFFATQSKGALIACALVTLVVVAIRAFTPTLPE